MPEEARLHIIRVFHAISSLCRAISISPGARPDPVAAPNTATPDNISSTNTPRSMMVMLPAATMGSWASTDKEIAEYLSPGKRNPWSTKIQPTTAKDEKDDKGQRCEHQNIKIRYRECSTDEVGTVLCSTL